MDHPPSVAFGARAHELRTILLPFITRRVAPEDVDDVLHDVLLRMQRGLGDLREGDKLIAWGYQIARNVIIDHLRRTKVRVHDDLDRTPTVAAPHADEDDAETAAGELARIVGHFVGMLPDPYREALQLTELDGLSQADAARRVGLSLPGMKSRVQRGRAQLRELLEGCCDIALDTRGSILEVEPRNRPADLPDCCARAGLHPSSPPRVSRDMTNTSPASKRESDTTPTTEEAANACCGGPAPAGTSACCVEDAAAKASGASGCGCGPKPGGTTRGCC